MQRFPSPCERFHFHKANLKSINSEDTLQIECILVASNIEGTVGRRGSLDLGRSFAWQDDGDRLGTRGIEEIRVRVQIGLMEVLMFPGFHFGWMYLRYWG